MITKINNLLSGTVPYLAADQRVQAKETTPLDQMYSSSLTFSATDTCNCYRPEHWTKRCLFRIIESIWEPISQFLQWLSRTDRQKQIGVSIALNLIIIITMPILLPTVIIIITAISIANTCYKCCTKTVVYFKARNLNEEDKKLVDLKFNDSYDCGFQSLHRTLKEELRVKVFQKAHAANERWYTAIPNDPYRGYDGLSEGQYTVTLNDPDWFNHTVKSCPQHHAQRVRCGDYPCFWDALDELIAEKINKP